MDGGTREKVLERLTLRGCGAATAWTPLRHLSWALVAWSLPHPHHRELGSCKKGREDMFVRVYLVISRIYS